MKRIILLLDGTWNDAAFGKSDTNIVRLREIINRSLDAVPAAAAAGIASPGKLVSGRASSGGTEHLVFYEKGVGTGPFDRIRGGAFGLGLEAAVRRAYKFLSFHYQLGDEVFVFGFSRGAYTARSLVGYIAAIGLLRRNACTPELEAKAWQFYRTAPNDRLPGIWTGFAPQVHDRDRFRIDCVGVFDTVGALGVPLDVLRRANRERYQFHDVELSSITKVNLHALGIDEKRRPFEAAVWRKPKFKHYASVTEQVWFPGVHADIGGGYVEEAKRSRDEPSLDDITLDWMVKRVKAHFPTFPIEPAAWTAIDAHWAAKPHLKDAWIKAPQNESRKTFYRLWRAGLRSIANYELAERSRRRREMNVCWDRQAEPIAEMVHVSALERLGTQGVRINGRERPYAPCNLLHVLQAIERTYGLGQRGRAGSDVLVVDWSGRTLDPELGSAGQGEVRRLMAGAQGALQAQGIPVP